jgi:Beta-propeller repeat
VDVGAIRRGLVHTLRESVVATLNDTGMRLLSRVAVCALLTIVALGYVSGSRLASPVRAAVPVLPFGDGTAFSPFRSDPVAQPTQREHGQLVARYGQLPLAFIRNEGQLDRRAVYFARGTGYTLFLTERAAVLGLVPAGSGERAGRSAAVSIGFAGANPGSRLVAETPLAGKFNYLIGDRSSWRTHVASYKRVQYKNLWPGIDAAFYGNQGQFEYDLGVAPGADPGRIALALSGAERVRVAESGALSIQLRGGSVRQLAPHAYQILDGVKVAVDSRYFLQGHRVGIRLGHYDHRLPLTIDPKLDYSTYLGGSGQDVGTGIAVDSSGAAYVTGYTTSTNFPRTSGAHENGNDGSYDAFVTKLNPSGTGLIFSTYVGGSADDRGFGIAVDTAGAAYVTGDTTSTNFPTTTAAYQPAHRGASDAFVAKLKPDGAGLEYATYLGGSLTDRGFGIAVDSSGAAYVTGVTGSSNFPTTAAAYQPAHRGASDVFVTKLNSSGTGLAYSTYLGGAGQDIGKAIAIDPDGAAYLTGDTTSPDFPTTAGAYQTALHGFVNAFVAKLKPDGAGLAYSSYLGGSKDDNGFSIAVGPSGAAYVTGQTVSPDFPTTPGAYQTSYGGVTDAFVTKLKPDGTGLAYSTYLGGSDFDFGYGIAVDPSGAAYVTGQTASTNFPTTPDAYQRSNSGLGNAFVTKLNSSGTGLTNSTYVGGSAVDRSYGIALDASGAAYITGFTNSTNFPITPNAYQTLNHGGTAAFVTKLALLSSVSAGPPRELKLSVSPRDVHAGKRTCFSIAVSSVGRPVAGTTIHFAGRSVRSSRRGTARICLSLRAGLYRARASKHGYRSESRSVRSRPVPRGREAPPEGGLDDTV